jgi:hypothetical protein
LNDEGTLTDLGRPWTRGTVHQVLTNEKYIGNNVYNRVSFKLKNKRVVNHPDMWIRADGAFAAIVDSSVFQAAQRIIQARCIRLTDEEMLVMKRNSQSQPGWASRDGLAYRQHRRQSSPHRALPSQPTSDLIADAPQRRQQLFLNGVKEAIDSRRLAPKIAATSGGTAVIQTS